MVSFRVAPYCEGAGLDLAALWTPQAAAFFTMWAWPSLSFFFFSFKRASTKVLYSGNYFLFVEFGS